jgi:hypothetical protein
MPRGGTRQGAGRKLGSKVKPPTRVVRVPASITDEQLKALESVILEIDHWEEECKANPGDVARYHFLKQAIEAIRATGF